MKYNIYRKQQELASYVLKFEEATPQCQNQELPHLQKIRFQAKLLNPIIRRKKTTDASIIFKLTPENKKMKKKKRRHGVLKRR